MDSAGVRRDALDRRAFLGAAGGFAAGAVLLGACGPSDGASRERDSIRPAPLAHQPGIAEPRQAAAKWVAYDGDPDAIVVAFGAAPELNRGSTTVTAALGASAFRGLSDPAPAELKAMPTFVGDQLDPAYVHGDLLVQYCGDDDATCDAAADGVRDAAPGLRQNWSIRGYRIEGRNALGFKEGTSNIDPGNPVHAGLLWTQDNGVEPGWAAGGTYMVIRLTSIDEGAFLAMNTHDQERVIGRRKSDSAPLGSEHEHDIPDFDADPTGAVIPLDSHIRRANPRSREYAIPRMLRRGYDYERTTESGDTDRGLAFVSFQRQLNRSFVQTQLRLEGEAMSRFTRVWGGGYFFAPPAGFVPSV